jgi:hypothetical protein
MSSRRRNERSRDSKINAAQPGERVYNLPAPSKNRFVDRTLHHTSTISGGVPDADTALVEVLDIMTANVNDGGELYQSVAARSLPTASIAETVSVKPCEPGMARLTLFLQACGGATRPRRSCVSMPGASLSINAR